VIQFNGAQSATAAHRVAVGVERAVRTARKARAAKTARAGAVAAVAAAVVGTQVL
jgi:hypothetical protein